MLHIHSSFVVMSQIETICSAEGNITLSCCCDSCSSNTTGDICTLDWTPGLGPEVPVGTAAAAAAAGIPVEGRLWDNSQRLPKVALSFIGWRLMKEIGYQFKMKYELREGPTQHCVDHIGIHRHHVKQVVKDILTPLIVCPGSGIGWYQLVR